MSITNAVVSTLDGSVTDPITALIGFLSIVIGGLLAFGVVFTFYEVVMEPRLQRLADRLRKTHAFGDRRQ